MKKRQDQFLQLLRWWLILLFFGLMILGFYWNYHKMQGGLQVPQIETTVEDPPAEEREHEQ